MTIEEAIKHCKEVADGLTDLGACVECAAEHRQLAEWLKELKAYKEQSGDAISTLEQTKWIPIKWHEITDEEREREDCPKTWHYYIDCAMPEDEQEILITVKDSKGRLWVENDICEIDEGYYLASGYDWVEDVVAWRPLPEPYKTESEDKARIKQ